MFRVNDFFCGAGGIGLGFKNAGFDIAGAWDKDKFAIQTYTHNVSPVGELKLVEEMRGEDLPEANVWSFGFPCNDISQAGHRKGMVRGETQSGLFYEIMRLLGEVDNRPEIILAENVKQVESLLPIINEEYIRAGYKMYSVLYDSKFWGVPLQRKRYFIVGVRDDIKQMFSFPRQVEKQTVFLSSILESDVEKRHYLSEKMINTLERHKARHQSKGNGFGWNPINRDTDYVKSLKANYYKIQGDSDFVVEGDGVRKLTPRECARLQGFPDDFEQIVSNTQFYIQMGNAVTVNVSQAIAEEISNFLHKHKK